MSVDVLTPTLTGEVRDAALMLAQAARDHGRGERICLLAGGETTVTLTGQGLGGRNQELALALGVELERCPASHPVSILCLGTDGSGGPTELHPEPYLANHDSYSFHKQAGPWVVTGPTRTNVMDVTALLIDPS